MNKVYFFQKLFFLITIVTIIVTVIMDKFIFISSFLLGLTFLIISYNYSKIEQESKSQNFMILGFLAFIYSIYKMVI